MKAGLFWFTVACVSAATTLQSIAGERAPDSAAADAKRAERQTAAATIALAPLRLGTPLLGPVGVDSGGYPTQYVDRAALRSLLSHGKYTELTRYFEEFQTAFEADPRKEYWPIDAGDAFASAEPELSPGLDAWVAATPKSFAPYLARGRYRISVAYARRGAAFASSTPVGGFAEMEAALIQAVPDLDRALELRPKLVAAMRAKLIGRRGGQDGRAIAERAIAVCPSCLQVRIAYIYELTPRWGGSHEAMARFAKERLDPSNPRLKILAGYVDYDKAQLLILDKKPKDALVAIERACAVGEHWEFLKERGSIKERLRDFDGAMKDLDRALALRPGEPAVILQRASAQLGMKRWEAGSRDLLTGLRIVPTDPLAHHLINSAVAGLIYEGWAHHTAGRRDDALRVYDLAAELAPRNVEVQSRRKTIVAAKAQADAKKACDLGNSEACARARQSASIVRY